MKYKSKRIGHMTPAELSAACKGLVLKVSVITGWQIPDSEEYITVLNDQLKKKFVDDYQDMNTDEFEYAMRTYGTKIKDWGKGLNLALIDDAICEYLGERQHISAIEEQKRTKEPQKSIENTGPVDWLGEWEKVLESARNGHLNSLFIVTPIYDWLKSTGRLTITARERKQIFADCREAYAQEMKVALRESKVPSQAAKAQYELLISEGDEWQKDPNLWARIINICKQETIKLQAINTIMDENK